MEKGKRKNMANQRKKKKINMNINSKLPEEIVKVILSKVNFSSLPNCIMVCKAWNCIVSDYASSYFKLFNIPNPFLLNTADFSNPHLQHRNPNMICYGFDSISSVSTFTFDPLFKTVKVYSSCNGLLYISLGIDIHLWFDGIWNPVTNEFFRIPRCLDDNYALGFGLTPKTKQYKLFRISVANGYNGRAVIEAWKVISNKWEQLESQPFKISDSGIYFDGVIYWCGRDSRDRTYSLIYVLDVETETFETVDILNRELCLCTRFHRLNRTLCLVVFYNLKVEVWMMRDKYSWNRRFVINLTNVAPYQFYPIKTSKDEEDIYLLVNKDLFCFGKNDKKIKIKTLFIPNDRAIKNMILIEAFHFGPLPKILAGNA